MKHSNNFLSISLENSLENTPKKYIDKAIESIPKQNDDRYQLKRANNKILKVKLDAKSDLYSSIAVNVVCLEILELDLPRNTLLILLCSVYLFT